MSERPRAARPGPRRPAGLPAGPDEVRRAVLDAAASLFARRGVDAVSLRDIAAEAHVQFALIRRYVGNREELERAVFDDLSTQLAQAVVDNPLEGQGFGPDTVMGKWVRVVGALVIADRLSPADDSFNPVQAMAATLTAGYAVDERTARVRAAQIVAAALGWRLFESYLIEAGRLDDVPLHTLRDDLARSARRLGATRWPSPPDPRPRRR